jgi:hypothetical protein
LIRHCSSPFLLKTYLCAIIAQMPALTLQRCNQPDKRCSDIGIEALSDAKAKKALLRAPLALRESTAPYSTPSSSLFMWFAACSFLEKPRSLHNLATGPPAPIKIIFAENGIDFRNLFLQGPYIYLKRPGWPWPSCGHAITLP